MRDPNTASWLDTDLPTPRGAPEARDVAAAWVARADEALSGWAQGGDAAERSAFELLVAASGLRRLASREAPELTARLEEAMAEDGARLREGATRRGSPEALLQLADEVEARGVASPEEARALFLGLDDLELLCATLERLDPERAMEVEEGLVAPAARVGALTWAMSAASSWIVAHARSFRRDLAEEPMLALTALKFGRVLRSLEADHREEAATARLPAEVEGALLALARGREVAAVARVAEVIELHPERRSPPPLPELIAAAARASGRPSLEGGPLLVWSFDEPGVEVRLRLPSAALATDEASLCFDVEGVEVEALVFGGRALPVSPDGEVAVTLGELRRAWQTDGTLALVLSERALVGELSLPR